MFPSNETMLLKNNKYIYNKYNKYIISIIKNKEYFFTFILRLSSKIHEAFLWTQNAPAAVMQLCILGCDFIYLWISYWGFWCPSSGDMRISIIS